MQFAIDENGIRTSINNSIKGKPYKCPCCGSEVIQKNIYALKMSVYISSVCMYIK